MPEAAPLKKTFLLVDDSRDYPALVERAFGKVQKGVFVHPVASGELALEHLARCGERIPLPDLVLLDRHMPGGIDGFETLRRVRLIERLYGLHVLIVAGSDDPEHLDEARASGADGYIIKPCEQDQWIVLAREILAWQPQDSWRRSGGAAAGLSLAAQEAEISSGAMIPANPSLTIQAAPGGSPNDPGWFAQALELAKRLLDPIQVQVNELCRQHHIPEAHARGRGQDQVTVTNRNAVILGMMDIGYSDRVILDNFAISPRNCERLRARWRAKRGGVLAVRSS